ncbi:MAG: glycosyltransferase family 39 protein [Vicinamibacterales bacterium]|nr:glycosyltransferase family 39 protein [Vicinamibacterales bacterium]
MTTWLHHDAGTPDRDIGIRTYWFGLALITLVAILLRTLFPLADPPWHAPSGIVWHDEGAWTHNARNMALFGQWATDRWNPMFLTPVFTGLEYTSFRLFGVGLWQARLVSEVLGVLSVLWLAGALRHTAGRTAGLAGAALLATHYTWVMWSRAALLEPTMVAFMVAALYAYARAHGRRVWIWGLTAGACAIVSFFAKAAAAFFLAALAAEASWSAWLAWREARAAGRRWRPGGAGTATLAGLALAGTFALIAFVVPYWEEFRFYNWQMSVTRKPSYTLAAIVDRASWFPVLHDFFTRMWVVVLLALGAIFSLGVRWRQATPVERLAVAWIALGTTELLLHDVGNERRLVFLIPPLVLLAATILARDRRLLAEEAARVTRRHAAAAVPLVLYALYVLTGSVTRLAFIYEIRPGVRTGALVAALLGAALYATWPRPARWLSRTRWSLRASAALLALVLAGDVAQFAQWAAGRTYANYDAMVAIGRWLPPGTLVHGKLANGLSLENRIRPVFVGRGFGNYEDRLDRDDVRYVLTYTRPYLGYEGRVIRDVLDAQPWHVLHTFPVAESPGGHDEAALIEKGPRPPGSGPGHIPR